MSAKPYSAAGQIFRDIRIQAGFATRDLFLVKAAQIFEYIPFSTQQIVRLELGHTEPSITHFLFYKELTDCPVEMINQLSEALLPSSSPARQ